MPTAIGIDFGTSYSCVGVFKNGYVDIIANKLGNNTIPSYVAFTDTERIIGDGAKNQVAVNPHNTVFDAKRLIGRKFDDPTVQSDIKHWPFKVISAEGGRPKVQVKFKGQAKDFHPEEISSMVLATLKENAEVFLNSPVKKAVIAVPAHFNNSQRKAIKDAGTIAGLNVLRIISEPTAAAIAYGYDKNLFNHNILVYDLGGGTFDVSILNIKNKKFKVKSTAGDTHLGGADFDDRIVDYFVGEFKSKYKKDLTTNPKAIRRLRTAVERAKRVLSTIAVASIEVDSIFDDIDFYTSITRARFEELCSDLFSQTLGHVKQALDDAGMDKTQVDDVVLVGGSTRIPKVQELLSGFFDGKELNKSINPDEAVAYGAAIYAARLSGDKSVNIQDLCIRDVAPLSLGIQVEGGVISPIIKRNTTIPTKRSKIYTTPYSDHRNFGIKIYEGEHYFAKDNNLLGTFTFDIPPRDVYLFEVTFEVDCNNLLHVTVLDESTGDQINITKDAGQLSQEEITRMAIDAEKYKAEDEAERERIAAMNNFEYNCLKLKRNLAGKRYENKAFEEYRQEVCNQCDVTLAWLNANRTVEKKEIESWQKTLKHFQQQFDLKD